MKHHNWKHLTLQENPALWSVCRKCGIEIERQNADDLDSPHKRWRGESPAAPWRDDPIPMECE